MQRIEKLIFDQADRTPDAIAVEHNGARLTYRQLKTQALEISQELRKSGLNAGQTVAMFQERSLATLPLMLAIWEAGGIVVPINPTTPAKMLETMIHDASPRIVLTDPSLKPGVAEAVNKVNLPSRPGVVAGDPRSNGNLRLNYEGFQNPIIDEDSCYVIYTSGSEGRPRGVVGSHQSLIHYLRWQAKEFAVNKADRFSQSAPLSFDFSLKELLVPLICGARVCIADRATVMNARSFVEWAHESKITMMCCVPTLLRSILQLPGSPADADVFRFLRALLISGDMLRWEDVSGWRARFGNEVALFNLYGPTESTVIKLFYRIPETKTPESINVPVGRPIPDTEILIVDELDEPNEPGEIGEIVILSEWLACGYLNDPSNNRFCALEYQGLQRRAYRTGDLGRWLGDGNLELIGRKDRQVKIRGYRIELNEIESILSEHAGITDIAVVTNASDADGLAVIACFFTTEQSGLTEREIRSFAKDRLLPQVLSLTRFYRVDTLPLMANGKVDRLKLASSIDRHEEPARADLSNVSLAAATVRERISAMWEELLAVEGINLEANFFELGGDSMTAIRLLRRLREELHPEVKLDDVYQFPSILQLSTRVEELLT
ncbi:MAG TPA: non-ribosomal peptide synthetase [Pyrinomonadaceae bacterium]|nr:non-ribosomal peptide synthetase [Pyrinomonadaceae bacterium]